jgi:prepilin-type N-terminal cleavage/methylation domain-containing protein
MLSDSETSQCRYNLRGSFGLRPQDDETNLFTLSPNHLFTSKNKKAAFTLAEVLITLGIIGVVAAITLPTLIQNHQKKTYVEGLKSGISILSQGFRKMLADEGVDDLANTEMWKNCNYNNFDTSSGRKACEPILSKYFKVVKFQSQSDLAALGEISTGDYTGSGCQNLVGKTNKRWYLNNKTKCQGRVSGITVTLSNGMKAILFLYTNNTYEAGEIDLDINGGKGPNTWGRDTFHLVILPNGNVVGYYDGQYAKALAEYYDQSADNYRATLKNQAESQCSSTSTQVGSTCSGRIINDGWKMNY